MNSIFQGWFMSNSIESYEPLAADDENHESGSMKKVNPDPVSTNQVWIACKTRQLGVLVILFTALALAFVVVLISGFILIRRQETSSSPYPSLQQPQLRSQFLDAGKWNYSNPSPCGHSPESAHNAGCLWSAMTFAWYPPACYDKEIEEEFLDLSDWQWYASDDLSPEDKLPVGAVLRGEIHRAYMSMNFHKMHCLYSFKKLFRAFLGLALSDNYVLRLGHMEHCEHYMVAENAPAVTGKQLYTNFG